MPVTSSSRGLAVWFTGLSGAGKTTLCRALQPILLDLGYPVEILDGDDMRQCISRDLGYSRVDRNENVHRIGCVAEFLVQQEMIVLVAAISPYRAARDRVRYQIGSFLEVYVNASLATCMARDPKQLYARALAVEVRNLTGMDDPYEPPLNPDVECDTENESCCESMIKVLEAIRDAQQERRFTC
jgi:adenylylsulfate kinase